MRLIRTSAWLLMVGVAALNGCNNDKPVESRELVPTAKTGQVAAAVSRSTPERMVLQLIDARDLSGEQRAQLAEIHRGITTDWHALSQTSTSAARDARTEISRAAPDTARIDQRTDEVLALEAALAHRVADQVLSLVATFTPAQRAHLVQHASFSTGRAALEPALRQMLSAPTGASDAPSTPVAPAPPADVVGRPELLGLAVFEHKGLTKAESQKAKKLRHELRRGLSDLDSVIDSVTPALVAELAKPAPDAAIVHAAVDKALAAHRATTVGSMHHALASRLSLSGGDLANLVPVQRRSLP